MKPYRLIAPLALAFISLVGAGLPSAAHATAYRHADVVFYSNDSVRLAQRLHNDQSACADYYISVTPTADGSPRAGVASQIHANGPQFHAMPEIRLTAWAAWVQANPGKTWYDAGVEVRRRMVTAGFDVTQGDTWAIDEVGSPSGTQMGADVFTGAGTARADLEDFARGLYTGDSGMPPAPGLVFVANPTQITSDLSQYKQQLEDFYGASSFWAQMSQDVRFWAQETYADARAWGVAGSTLDDRAAHLNDYFQHALMLGEAGPGSTDAARSFLEAAYTPVGNSAYPQTEPELQPGGIGYGFTNIPLVPMQNFVSTQTYALRSFSAATGTGDRFGFAWWLKTAGVPAATFVSLADRIAGSIHGSETDPSGACGSAGEWCDSSVDGAQFTEAWKTFAAWSPPTNTPEGSSVQVRLAPAVTVTFSSVSSRGSTQVTTSDAGAAPPSGVQLLPGALLYDVETTAAFTGPVGVCIGYDAAASDGYALQLFRLGDDGWSDDTSSVDGTSVCGTADALGTFAIFAHDATPPTLGIPADMVVDATDPAGAAVTFVATATDAIDASPSVQCAPVSGTVFAAGTTTVTCTATDAAGNAATATFTVRVEGAGEQLADLAGSVTGVGPGTSLVATVDIARLLLAFGQPRAACLTLSAFTLGVRMQSGKKIPAAQATALIGDATRIRHVLGCTT
jgi:HYR domain